MQYRTIFLTALCQGLLTGAYAQTDAPADAALQTISQLAAINGQALACSSFAQATRAKQLMLTHAPKTARFGDAFEEATHQAFLKQNQMPCPATSAFNRQLDAVELTLKQVLPAPRPASSTPTPAQ